ncbi:MAG TPA: monovalent cation/H+ antiporter subunit D, partial [Xanthomonadaceae bacterium]|nr:monovalent cation/H+ antiporter subunit D [Xanthomonadaceae bacterium]
AEDAPERAPPRRARMRPVETGATVLLLGYVVAMTVAAGPLMHYADATAAQLARPGDYVQQLRATSPVLRQP